MPVLAPTKQPRVRRVRVTSAECNYKIELYGRGWLWGVHGQFNFQQDFQRSNAAAAPQNEFSGVIAFFNALPPSNSNDAIKIHFSWAAIHVEQLQLQWTVWMIPKCDWHFSPWVWCAFSFLLESHPQHLPPSLGSRLSFRSTSLTLMMRITSLIRPSFCTKLGRYGTLAPVLQTRLCSPPATTKVSPSVSLYGQLLFVASLGVTSLCFAPISFLYFCPPPTAVLPATRHLHLIIQFAFSFSAVDV